MVQIVEGPGSKFQQFFNAFKPGLESGLGTFSEDRLRKKENAALREKGYDIPENVRTQKFREALLESSIKKQAEQEKLGKFRQNLEQLESLGFLPKGASKVEDEALAKLLANFQIGQKEATSTQEREIAKEERAETREIDKENREIQRMQNQARALDIDESIIEPSVQRAVIENAAKQKKSQVDLEKDIQGASVIEKYFGKNAAELYPQLTEGGKTKFFEQLLMGKLEGQDLEKMLEGYEQNNPEDFVEKTTSQTSQAQKPGLPKKEEFQFPKIQPPKNRTPKELSDYRKEVRKENVPLYQDANSKIKALKNEKDHLKILNELSPKVPDGIGRVFINPQGQIRSWAQILKLVPPEAERFVKTVNDFISGAKDIFGARVTNFDLQTFQSRLPTLINSEEGRKQIIRQMEIFNEIESNYNEALKKVYNHYKLDGISQEEAQQIAEKMIKPREDFLRKELSRVGLPQYDLEELPDPASNKGKLIEDSSGKKFRSNGTFWEPV